ncbi:MAG: hypothetical protein Q7T16_01960 [Candidatus Burarchaeum sp.]|nr:hypothetical protein [Candidatus Burarchaeum sp.]MDO8339398.1 hypothetical protein [Candidatus Burarchaeum sp.]
MAEELEAVLKKNEQGPLDKFRNESLIYKQFGNEGVRVYSLITSGSKARDLLAQMSMNEGKLIELLEFMDSRGLVTIEHEGAAAQAVASQRRTEAEHEIAHELEGREKEIRREALPPLSRTSPFSTPSARPGLPSATAPFAPSAMPSTPAAPAAALQAEPAPPSLSPLEKTIYKKFGKIGLNVYNLIDGEKTAEEILQDTGIGEVKLVEILEFMDKEGIIRLEKPGGEEKPKDKKPKFEPLHEEKREVEERLSPDAIPIDLPVLQNMGLAQSIILRVELATRFPSYGLKVHAQIKAQKDVVEIARDLGLSLDQVDSVLALLGKRGAALMKAYKPKDARAKYGDDGLAIYTKYGRDGILIYELVGKEDSIKDIVKKSGIDKSLAVDIFLYIHKILGMELPIDRNSLLRQFG